MLSSTVPNQKFETFASLLQNAGSSALKKDLIDSDSKMRS